MLELTPMHSLCNFCSRLDILKSKGWGCFETSNKRSGDPSFHKPVRRQSAARSGFRGQQRSRSWSRGFRARSWPKTRAVTALLIRALGPDTYEGEVARPFPSLTFRLVLEFWQQANGSFCTARFFRLRSWAPRGKYPILHTGAYMPAYRGFDDGESKATRLREPGLLAPTANLSWVVAK